MGARIVGCVLNNTDIRHDEYYEYYTSYYQYYSPMQSTNRKSSPEDPVDNKEKGKKVNPARETRGDY